MKRIVEPKPIANDIVGADDVLSIQPMNFAELKAHTKLRDSRKKVKGIMQVADFANKVKSDLMSYSVVEGHYDHALVLKICDIAEMFFVAQGSGEVK